MISFQGSSSVLCRSPYRPRRLHRLLIRLVGVVLGTQQGERTDMRRYIGFDMFGCCRQAATRQSRGDDAHGPDRLKFQPRIARSRLHATPADVTGPAGGPPRPRSREGLPDR
jgi:hypothetical protein